VATGVICCLISKSHIAQNAQYLVHVFNEVFLDVYLGAQTAQAQKAPARAAGDCAVNRFALFAVAGIEQSIV
jgi:hypothetical protein